MSSLSPYLLLQGTSILPPEHAASLCRCYEEKQSPLQEHLRACSLRGECGGVGSGFMDFGGFLLNLDSAETQKPKCQSLVEKRVQENLDLSLVQENFCQMVSSGLQKE